MNKMKYEYIELSYYEHNRTFPEKSGDVGKILYEQKSHIARLTPYIASTKIHTTYGDVYEVCETAEEIWALMNS